MWGRWGWAQGQGRQQVKVHYQASHMEARTRRQGVSTEQFTNPPQTHPPRSYSSSSSLNMNHQTRTIGHFRTGIKKRKMGRWQKKMTLEKTWEDSESRTLFRTVFPERSEMVLSISNINRSAVRKEQVEVNTLGKCFKICHSSHTHFCCVWWRMLNRLTAVIIS